MAGYSKKSFDKCLSSIVSELGRFERDHPDWPDNAADAAEIIYDKAARLLSASANLRHGSQKDNNRI